MQQSGMPSWEERVRRCQDISDEWSSTCRDGLGVGVGKQEEEGSAPAVGQEDLDLLEELLDDASIQYSTIYAERGPKPLQDARVVAAAVRLCNLLGGRFQPDEMC